MACYDKKPEQKVALLKYGDDRGFWVMWVVLLEAEACIEKNKAT